MHGDIVWDLHYLLNVIIKKKKRCCRPRQSGQWTTAGESNRPFILLPQQKMCMRKRLIWIYGLLYLSFVRGFGCIFKLERIMEAHIRLYKCALILRRIYKACFLWFVLQTVFFGRISCEVSQVAQICCTKSRVFLGLHKAFIDIML